MRGPTRVETRGAARAATKPGADAARYDAFASSLIVDRAGKGRVAALTREPTGKLHLRFGETTKIVDGAGSAVAVADLDQDGEPEIITTANDPDDAIAIASWSGGEPRERLRIPAPGGVRALAVCPPEEHDAPALLAVVGDEVWLVR